MIIAGVAGLVVFTSKVFAKKPITLPTDQITKKIENLGEEILGTATKILPGSKSLKEKSKNVSDGNEQTSQGEVAGETALENQVQEIVDTIKELPAEQLDQIKKQIFKDFCQKVMEE